jgi:hypothetical protein
MNHAKNIAPNLCSHSGHGWNSIEGFHKGSKLTIKDGFVCTSFQEIEASRNNLTNTLKSTSILIQNPLILLIFVSLLCGSSQNYF